MKLSKVKKILAKTIQDKQGLAQSFHVRINALERANTASSRTDLIGYRAALGFLEINLTELQNIQAHLNLVDTIE